MENVRISYYEDNGSIILEHIEVNPEHRGKGLARQAMQDFVNKFKNERIELHAYAQDEHTDTSKLVDFYRSFGFDVVSGDESFGYEMIYDPYC